MKAWFLAMRAISLTAVLAPSLAVLLEGHALGLAIHGWRALAALLGVSFLLLGVNMQNDVEDDARGIDGPGSLGGSGVIQAGSLAPIKLQRAAYGLMAAGLLLGLPTLVIEPRAMLGLGTLTLIGASGYSGKPFGFKYHALGDITVFLLCGPLLTFGASIAMFGKPIAHVWAIGALFGLAAAAILHVNNMQDVTVDSKAGARTLALVLGSRVSKLVLVFLYGLAIVAWGSMHLSWLPFLIGILGFIPAVRLVVRILSAPDLGLFPLLRVEAAQAHLAIGVAVALGFFVGGF